MSVEALLFAARWLHFAALSLMFGAPLFWFYAFADPLAASRLWPKTFAATRRLLRVAAPAATLSGVAWLCALIVNAASDPADPQWGALFDSETLKLFFLETEFGAAALLRLGLLAGALALAMRPKMGLAVFAAFGVLGALLFVNQAFLGHAAQGGAGFYGATMIAAYSLHVLGAGAWIGGLAPLLSALAEDRDGGDKVLTAKLDVLLRYSAIAMMAVAAVLLGGVANIAFRLGRSFQRLFETPYGDILCAKVAMAVLMLALACFNRFVLTPRFQVAGKAQDAPAGFLIGAIAAELILGFAVLAAAAILGVTPPPQ
ncbi:CopD family protein [Methylocella silvestris]|uniref:Copper resistance protein D domain-containing protein n=1 Tax=Methylocella silvestris TaxID=199596 RepID=A0A2J7THW9_METSI|nr:CopD family protein [Methylocella silvestris]PNG26365.1 hypothetical protein CR492_08110 [Methylocella silvestris]